MKQLLCLLFLLLTMSSFGQNEKNKKKNYFPLWTFQQDSINIHGFSLGLWSSSDKPRHTKTNGIKLEIIGIGILLPLIPSSPIVKSDSTFLKLKSMPLSERINGLSLSATGTVCDCLTNGLTAGLIGQVNFQVNGISTSILGNFSQKHNGIMMALFVNEAFIMNGIQLGSLNISNKTKGLQIGVRNNANIMKGIQIGLFNKSKKLRGIQIGLWNVNQKRKFPLINWNFRREKE